MEDDPVRMTDVLDNLFTESLMRHDERVHAIIRGRLLCRYDKRRDILTETTAGLNHRPSPNPGSLAHQHIASEDHVIFQDAISGNLTTIAEYTTISDPRAVLLKELARDLAHEKGREREFAFLELLEERAIATFGKIKNNGKTVSSNVDFYSGFVYEMIGLPQEIYTPLFAMARIVGWCAHRNEELNFEGKRIIRPAYKNVLEEEQYVPLKKR